MGKVFFVQQNFKVGDTSGNAELIIAAAKHASSIGADIVLSPELSLAGYPAEDLLFSPTFQTAIDEALQKILAAVPKDITILVGLPLTAENNIRHNACVIIRNGRVIGAHKKSALPNYSVFDEKRYFDAPDASVFSFETGGDSYAVLICEEMWQPGFADAVAKTNAANTLVLNGSPFFTGKQRERHEAAASFAKTANSKVYYANCIGGQDDLVFDGASFVVNPDGKLVGQLSAFCETNGFADSIIPYPDDTPATVAALQLGLRDYVQKSSFADGVLLGLSGGVDSALVASLAADALGASQVMTVMMPTQYTSTESLEDAAWLAHNLGIEHAVMPLADSITALQQTVSPLLIHRSNDNITAENLQARLRGMLLMTLSNNRNLLLLATGNKSEIAVGYSTLYGDTNGGFAPIKDALKTEVWELCRHRNNDGEVIPERIIRRAPTAELRANQTDQDTLPPYPLLDAILSDHLSHLPVAEMQKKYDKIVLNDFYRRLSTSEYKRRQAPPGTKISRCSFGRDWRMPIANQFSHA